MVVSRERFFWLTTACESLAPSVRPRDGIRVRIRVAAGCRIGGPAAISTRTRVALRRRAQIGRQRRSHG